mmetsp:Transcript_169713/g.544640  ORF Transcript_169713/g.544640 Transcript_169713/m.544640 type:complete len:233 (+) Transcript_169713:751-1449(+)
MKKRRRPMQLAHIDTAHATDAALARLDQRLSGEHPNLGGPLRSEDRPPRGRQWPRQRRREPGIKLAQQALAPPIQVAGAIGVPCVEEARPAFDTELEGAAEIVVHFWRVLPQETIAPCPSSDCKLGQLHTSAGAPSHSAPLPPPQPPLLLCGALLATCRRSRRRQRGAEQQTLDECLARVRLSPPPRGARPFQRCQRELLRTGVVRRSRSRGSEGNSHLSGASRIGTARLKM